MFLNTSCVIFSQLRVYKKNESSTSTQIRIFNNMSSSEGAATSSAMTMGDMTTKSEVLEILDLIQEGIESSVYFRFGKRQKKLRILARVREKVMASTDQLSLARAMDGDAVADASCLPSMRRRALKGKEEVGELRLQVTSALKFLNSRARLARKEALEAIKEGQESSPPELDETYDEDDEFSEDDTAASGNYDGDTEKDNLSNTGLSSCESTNDGEGEDCASSSSQDQPSHIVTTCSVEDEHGPLGFSITTWRKYTLKESSGLGKKAAVSNPSSEAPKSGADGDGDGENNTDETKQGTESDEGLEQVSVRFGKGGIVHASRTRSVRFKGIKPSTDDNIFRAKELLEKYRS